MHSLLLLDMAASAHGDRVAVQHGSDTLTYDQLLAAAWGAGARFTAERPDGGGHVAYLGANGLAFPVALFGAAAAEMPFVPLNYRLSDHQLTELLARHDDLVVVADASAAPRLAQLGHEAILAEDLLAWARATVEVGDAPGDGDGTWVLLYTSGTTAAPKAAVLRHRHLTSYVIGSVEFAGAEETDAVLVSVPPYHIAGIANLLSNLYLGRRIVYLDAFDAAGWLETVRREHITHAMVVPTMLTRLCEYLEGEVDAGTPSLQALSYGGARTPVSVVERVMQLFPDTGLTNAYGLTETSSTIAILGPDEHRAAFDDPDPAARARLSSAGRVLPTVEVEIRDDDAPVPAGEPGEIFVRGEQVSGEYRGLGRMLDDEGWFPTRDRGWLDEEGYLFVEGRSDDTIIRGGENVAPAEIEETLLAHPGVGACAVVGVPDDEWGQRIAAAVVPTGGSELDPEELREFVRERLRSSKTPDAVAIVDELPYTETGKLLRRVVLQQFVEADPTTV